MTATWATLLQGRVMWCQGILRFQHFPCTFQDTIIPFSSLQGWWLRGVRFAWLCCHISRSRGVLCPRVQRQYSCVKGKCVSEQVQYKASRCSITFTSMWKLLSQLFYYVYLPLPAPPPRSSRPPWTVLGWRLKSLEWAQSNFYPSSLYKSHDPSSHCT